MKEKPLFLGALLLANSLLIPLTPVSAQTTDVSNITVDQWERIMGRRVSGDLQAKVDALGTTPVASIPVPILFGVAVSNLTANFGDPRPRGPHKGEDILAPKGTPIVSPTAAVVVKMDYGAGQGNGVYTMNPGGERFVYYHLDRYAEGLAVGQVLAVGSLIGYVGDTGDAAGGPAHLHFEIHSGGTAIDPFPRLSAEFTPAQKTSFLTVILGQSSDPVTLSRFLVTNFRSTFLAALGANITLPLSIVEALGSIAAGAARTTSSLPTGDLDSGSTGAAVVTLQRYLIQSASGPAAVRLAGAGATGTFGPMTKTALVEYQASAGITPATGYYGEATRAHIASHPLTAAATSPIATAGTTTLLRNLTLGMTGEDVRTLQRILNANGYPIASTGSGSLGNETPYFGPATKAAVIKFQLARNILPSIGYVGPLTKTALALL